MSRKPLLNGLIKRTIIPSVLVAILLLNLASIAYAAPSSAVSVETDNIIEVGSSQEVVVTFQNTASSDINDVASTIQFITFAAANLNPSRTLIALNASWEIYANEADPVPRVIGTVTGVNTPEIYAPYSVTSPIDMYTWALGKPSGTLDVYTDTSQFDNSLKILRPGEVLKLTITALCGGLVGDSRIWFFFRATEYEPTSIPVPNINTIPEAQRMNLYYSKSPGPIQMPYWWPLHNSYDPYDADINTGHVFEQVSWTRRATTRAFSKSNKLVHQIAVANPEEGSFSFHICGMKFNDLNRDGIHDSETEPGINGVAVTLLGPDQQTKAEVYYEGKFIYTPPDDTNPLESGENGLEGSFCFNLQDVQPGTYVFYVREDVPPGWVATTPTLIGPITLVASDSGPRESLHNNFGNASPQITRVPALSQWGMIGMATLLAGFLIWAARRKRSNLGKAL
ncbi:MAG: IPTL-CTERM sorting domain-containing protein [Chloroflexi bacterium]|nr:IPTL-CTERM sorting domain-containing protein [Chloroflexota bacterium]